MIHMRGDVRDPAEKEFRDVLSLLEKDYDYGNLRQEFGRRNAAPVQSSELHFGMKTAVSGVVSSALLATRQMAVKSYDHVGAGVPPLQEGHPGAARV